MRTTATLILSMLVVVTGCTTTSDPATKPAEQEEAGRTASPATQSDDAKVTVTYDDLGHEMDIYSPVESDRPPTDDGDRQSTAVLLVHGVGGGGSAKDHPGFVAWGERLSEAGLVAAVPNFDAVVGGSDDGTHQLGQALAVLRQRLADLGREDSAVVTMGFSAGGPDWIAASFDPANQPISALVGYYAEIEPPDGSGTGERSLSARRTEDVKPLLLAYGRRDSAPNISASLRVFRSAPRPAGGDTTILMHPHAGHAFDLDDDARTRTIIDGTIDFIAQARG